VQCLCGARVRVCKAKRREPTATETRQTPATVLVFVSCRSQKVFFFMTTHYSYIDVRIFLNDARITSYTKLKSVVSMCTSFETIITSQHYMQTSQRNMFALEINQGFP
jgi:hypothetical protein